MPNTIISPIIFAREVVRNRDRKNVFLPHCNREYEGEIKGYGDTVDVQTLPTITFVAQGITNAGNPDHTTGTGPGQVLTATDFVIVNEKLVIDKFAEGMVQITEHQRVQSNLKLTQKVANRFAEAEKRLFDDQVVNQIYMVQASDIPAASKTAVAITEANVFAQIEVLRVALKKNNVDDNIALFVSPQIESWLLQSKLLDNSDTGLMARFKGYIGMLSGLRVYTSNALSDNRMVAMAEDAINFIVQLVMYDLRKPANQFVINLLYLLVWGLKIFGENAKAIAFNDEPSES